MKKNSCDFSSCRDYYSQESLSSQLFRPHGGPGLTHKRFIQLTWQSLRRQVNRGTSWTGGPCTISLMMHKYNKIQAKQPVTPPPGHRQGGSQVKCAAHGTIDIAHDLRGFLRARETSLFEKWINTAILDLPRKERWGRARASGIVWMWGDGGGAGESEAEKCGMGRRGRRRVGEGKGKCNTQNVF